MTSIAQEEDKLRKNIKKDLYEKNQDYRIKVETLIKEKLNWYSSDCEFHWAYCKYFWEAHPNLPHIDINELEAFIENNK